MIIYLKHDKHGTKVAISDLEAKQDEKNGWTRFNPFTTLFATRSEDNYKEGNQTITLNSIRKKSNDNSK